MSSITNPSFSLHNSEMGGNKIESKGKKGRQCPDIYKVGPIPPKKYQNPDVIYLDPFAGSRPKNPPPKQKNAEFVARSSDEKAREAYYAFSAQKQGFLYQQGTANAKGSNSGLSYHKESSGSKHLAVGLGSSTGVKALAVHSTSSSSISKAPAVFSSKFGGKSLL